MRGHDKLTELVIGAAITVHRYLGPGLLEAPYEECLCHELNQLGLAFERQVPLPVRYRAILLDCGYRLDIVVQNELILEIKALERLLPIHAAQLVTYLRLSDIRRGLLLNFGAEMMREGIKRIANDYQRLSDTQS